MIKNISNLKGPVIVHTNNSSISHDLGWLSELDLISPSTANKFTKKERNEIRKEKSFKRKRSENRFF